MQRLVCRSLEIPRNQRRRMTCQRSACARCSWRSVTILCRTWMGCCERWLESCLLQLEPRWTVVPCGPYGPHRHKVILSYHVIPVCHGSDKFWHVFWHIFLAYLSGREEDKTLYKTTLMKSMSSSPLPSSWLRSGSLTFFLAFYLYVASIPGILVGNLSGMCLTPHPPSTASRCGTRSRPTVVANCPLRSGGKSLW